MAFMTDKARVLGASTPEGNRERLAVLPQGLQAAMMEILSAENVVVGRKSYDDFYSSPSMARKDVYVLTQDRDFEPKTNVKVCHDHMELARRFQDSDDELLVPGGLQVLKLFTSCAQVVDVAEAPELVPGDLIFDDWEQGDFELVSVKEWDSGRTLHLERKS